MKSEVGYGKIDKDNKYPYLGLFDNGIIVMFFAENEGICVHAEGKYNQLGEYSKYWLEHDCKYYNGKLILSNK